MIIEEEYRYWLDSARPLRSMLWSCFGSVPALFFARTPSTASIDGHLLVRKCLICRGVPHAHVHPNGGGLLY